MNESLTKIPTLHRYIILSLLTGAVVFEKIIREAFTKVVYVWLVVLISKGD